jgi:hypothetical protein
VEVEIDMFPLPRICPSSVIRRLPARLLLRVVLLCIGSLLRVPYTSILKLSLLFFSVVAGLDIPIFGGIAIDRMDIRDNLVRRYEPFVEGQHTPVEWPLAIRNIILDAPNILCNQRGIRWSW